MIPAAAYCTAFTPMSGKPHHAYMPCRRRPDNQPDLYSRSPALSPAVPVAPTTPSITASVAALAELDDAGLARLITAALKEGQRRLYPSFGTSAVIDPALVAAIGTNQAPASAQAAQGLERGGTGARPNQLGPDRVGSWCEAGLDCSGVWYTGSRHAPLATAHHVGLERSRHSGATFGL